MRPSQLDPDGHHLRVTQVAEVLSVSKTTIYRYLERGDVFPNAFQLLADWRIPQRDVIAYCDRDLPEQQG